LSHISNSFCFAYVFGRVLHLHLGWCDPPIYASV
jgi:hypothetical protein